MEFQLFIAAAGTCQLGSTGAPLGVANFHRTARTDAVCGRRRGCTRVCHESLSYFSSSFFFFFFCDFQFRPKWAKIAPNRSDSGRNTCLKKKKLKHTIKDIVSLYLKIKNKKTHLSLSLSNPQIYPSISPQAH